jgi:RAB protein geranylgeranyltransferase component A
MPATDTLLRDLSRLVHDEQQAANQQLLAIWERPLSEKLLKGITQGGHDQQTRKDVIKRQGFAGGLT